MEDNVGCGTFEDLNQPLPVGELDPTHVEQMGEAGKTPEITAGPRKHTHILPAVDEPPHEKGAKMA